MKKSMVITMVLLWLLCVLVVANGFLPKLHGKSTGNKQVKPADNKPEVSIYGNLFQWSGKSFLNEGYELRYEYTNPRKHKKEEKLVSAIGNGRASGLQPVAPDDNPPSANTTKAMKTKAAKTKDIITEVRVMKTEDGVLTLTRKFILNDDTKVPNAWLIVKNDTSFAVNLQNVKLQMTCKCTDSSANLECCNVKVLSYAGTDCEPDGICPVPKDLRRSYAAIVSVKPLPSGEREITYTWTNGKNVPLNRLQPGHIISFGNRFSH